MADAPNQLAPAVVRTALVFQVLIAAPFLILLGREGWLMVDSDFNGPSSAYQPVRDLALALIAAVILFILVVQKSYAKPPARLTAQFELAKGILATVAWIWLLLDAIFCSPDGYRYGPIGPYGMDRKARIIFTAASVSILLIFFYPTMFWSARLAREADQEVDQEAASGQETAEQEREATEEQPLLRI